MPEVSCYSMDLYCDTGDPEQDSYGTKCPHKGLSAHTPVHQYTGRNRTECVRDAKAHGWTFKADGHVICPKCTRGAKRGRR